MTKRQKNTPITLIMSVGELCRSRREVFDPPVIVPIVRFRDDLATDDSAYPMSVLFTENNALDVFARFERKGIIFGPEARFAIARKLMLSSWAEVL